MKKSCYRYRTSLTLFISALVAAVSADAAYITVTSPADAGGSCPGASCTLRQAIATAVSDDTINFAAGITTISLTSAELLINKNLTISGPGANLFSVQRSAAAANFRIFNIASASVTATSSGLPLVNGKAGGSAFPDNVGGAVFNAASLALADCALSGNSATSNGGCIYNNGSGSNIALTLLRCTLNGNSASNAGGGILNAGYGGHATVSSL